MDTQQIISLFGSYAADPKVESFLKSVGITQRPKLPKGEYNAYLGAKKLGLDLLFQDEAYFKKQKKPIGKNPLVLVGAFFYSKGQGGFSEYEGELPGKLAFSDSRDRAIRRLGGSEWNTDEGGVVLRERWIWSGKKILVHYGPGADSIVLIYCGIV